MSWLQAGAVGIAIVGALHFAAELLAGDAYARQRFQLVSQTSGGASGGASPEPIGGEHGGASLREEVCQPIPGQRGQPARSFARLHGAAEENDDGLVRRRLFRIVADGIQVVQGCMQPVAWSRRMRRKTCVPSRKGCRGTSCWAAAGGSSVRNRAATGPGTEPTEARTVVPQERSCRGHPCQKTQSLSSGRLFVLG